MNHQQLKIDKEAADFDEAVDKSVLRILLLTLKRLFLVNAHSYTEYFNYCPSI